MENKVYTQNELKAQNIITMDYALNLEPGEFVAVLDLKAQASKRHQSRRQEKPAESVQMEIEHHPRYPDAAGILRRCAEFQNALQVIQKPPPY